MPHCTKPALCAALCAAHALAPTLSSAQTLIQRPGGDDPAPRGLVAVPNQQITGPSGLAAVAGGSGGTTADNGVFCGSGSSFYWYEEDANGNEVPGTRQYGCDYD